MMLGVLFGSSLHLAFTSHFIVDASARGWCKFAMRGLEL
jgi:hypothetical protein